MQYSGPYSRNGHQTHQPHTSHHSRQSPANSNPPSSRYPQQHPHAVSGYPLPNGMIDDHTNSMLQPIPFSNHPHHDTTSTMDPHAQYYQMDPHSSYFSSHQPASPPGAQYAMNLPPHSDPMTVRAHAHTQQFIPTPSQTYQAYPGTSASSRRVRPTVEPYYHMSPNSQTVQRSSSPPGPHSAHTNISPSTNPALLVDRYPCNLCDRSFTRSHDRKRHYDTVHASAPVLHRCSYCGKDFSRADSLKRHVDNGCDEMLSHK